MASVQERPAVVTPERFASGLTYEEYMGRIKVNKDQFESNYQAAPATEDDVAFFKKVIAQRGGLRVLAIAEDWCPDVYRGLPIMAKIAQLSGIELRVFPRDENLDIMDQYLNQGQFRSVPTFACFDGKLNPIGTWHERPRAANETMAKMRADLEKLKLSEEDARAEYRKRIQPEWDNWRRETVRELRELLTQ
ncbi:MAG: thioredoxin family protein [Chloroflexi bacterium]|nr:thioredoxin family protein [Chloroflexota bacterium]